MTEIVEVYSPQIVIEDVIDSLPGIVEVVEAGPGGPQGTPGFSYESMAFSKSGALATPYTSPLAWMLVGSSVLSSLAVTLNTAPSVAALMVSLKNGPTTIASVTLGVGIQSAQVSPSNVNLADGDTLTISLSSAQPVPGAADMVATVRRRLV